MTLSSDLFSPTWRLTKRVSAMIFNGLLTPPYHSDSLAKVCPCYSNFGEIDRPAAVRRSFAWEGGREQREVARSPFYTTTTASASIHWLSLLGEYDGVPSLKHIYTSFLQQPALSHFLHLLPIWNENVIYITNGLNAEGRFYILNIQCHNRHKVFFFFSTEAPLQTAFVVLTEYPGNHFCFWRCFGFFSPKVSGGKKVAFPPPPPECYNFRGQGQKKRKRRMQ